MNNRTATLRRHSQETDPSISCERAELLTEFYEANDGRYSIPVMRALRLRAPVPSTRRSTSATAS